MRIADLVIGSFNRLFSSIEAVLWKMQQDKRMKCDAGSFDRQCHVIAAVGWLHSRQLFCSKALHLLVLQELCVKNCNVSRNAPEGLA